MSWGRVAAVSAEKVVMLRWVIVTSKTPTRGTNPVAPSLSVDLQVEAVVLVAVMMMVKRRKCCYNISKTLHGINT